MRVAVLSEIHADLQALERVLDVVDHARAEVFMGGGRTDAFI